MESRASYDGLNRVYGEKGTSPSGVLYNYLWLCDAGGNLRFSGEYTAGLPARALELGYDAADRLSREESYDASDALQSSVTYAYDAANNRTSKTAGGVTTSYSFNSLNQLTGWSGGGVSASCTYDFNGNRVTRSSGGQTDTYGYDAENRLVSLAKNTSGGSGTYSYSYDYRTRRVARTENGSTTGIVFSGGTSVQEYDAAGALAVDYVRGSDWGGGVGGILYSMRSGSASYAHYNRRGDVTAQTNAAGTLTYQASYQADGRRTVEYGSTPDRQKANTKEEDPSGLLNEGFRFRDLETLTFLTRDPAGFVDGPNLYSYVRQNPWSKFDPEGLSAYSDMLDYAGEQGNKGGAVNWCKGYGATFAAVAWNAFSFGSAAKNGEAGDKYSRGEISGKQFAGQLASNTGTAVAKGAVIYGTGGLAAGASVPAAMALGAGAGAGVEGLDIANDRGNAAIEGKAYAGSVGGDVAKIARGAGTGAVIGGGSILALDAAVAFKQGFNSAKVTLQQTQAAVDEATVSIFHKGNLADGQVTGGRELYGTLSRESAEGYARAGTVHEFQVPKKTFSEWEETAKVLGPYRDFDLSSNRAFPDAVKVQPSASSELNKYKRQ